MAESMRLPGISDDAGFGDVGPLDRPAETIDLRFRALVGEDGWRALPEQVRRRFSKRLGADDVVLYRGHVVATSLSRAGRLVAFLARLVGAPLPLTDGATGPAVVSVTEDTSTGGQCWTRTYARPGGFPQVIHSAKRFRGPTGLEEYVGYGLAMALEVHVEGQSLVFRSSGYVLEIRRCRLKLPGWLTPGTIEITHTQDCGEEFSFHLTLDHPWFGRMISQTALFRDV